MAGGAHASLHIAPSARVYVDVIQPPIRVWRFGRGDLRRGHIDLWRADALRDRICLIWPLGLVIALPLWTSRAVEAMNPKFLQRDTDCERDARQPIADSAQALNAGASTGMGSPRESSASPAQFCINAPRRAWLLTWLLAGTRARLMRFDGAFLAILCGPESRVCHVNP